MRDLFACIAVLIITISSTAAHAALHDRGSGLIYDDVLDITWMQYANYAGTTMTWDNAFNWVSSLSYHGYSDWRMPASDYSCTGYSCTGSELGHLYYIDGTTSDSPGLFIDVRPYMYWSGPDSSDPSKAWRYNMSTGYQGTSAKTYSRYVWAVRDGDSAPPAVPEPASFILFVAGGAALGIRKCHVHKRLKS